MSKKRLICLCVFLLALLSAMGAGAELKNINNADKDADGIRTVIYYVPATKDDQVIASAKTVAQAIIARWPGRPVICQKYFSNKIQYNYSDNVFTRGGDEGKSNLNALPENTDTIPCDVWFIVPGDAVSGFAGNEELMQKCGEILGNEHSLLHIVFIGNTAAEISGDSALGRLEQEGKTDWIFITPDFMQDSVPVNSDGALHTGSYLIASLFGRPADLPGVWSEEGDSYTYELAENIGVFVLIEWEGSTGKAEFRNDSNDPIDVDSSLTIKAKNISLTGTMLRKMEKGGYKVTAPRNSIRSIRVYWYPDLSGINPEPDMGENWQRGDNEITLRFGKLIADPDSYTVQFTYQDDVNEAAGEKETPYYARYDSEKGYWTKTISVEDQNVGQVSIVPSVRINMADGNQIWAWTGERMARNVVSGGIAAKPDAPGETVVYADNETGETGSVTFEWKNIFDFTPEDNPEFTVSAAEELTAEPGVSVKKTASGKKLQIKAVAGEGLADEYTVAVTGNVTDSDGETQTAEHLVRVVRRDVTTLFEGISLTYEQEGQEIHAGKEIIIHAEIDTDTLKDWEEACGQIEAFPRPDQLRLFVTTGEDAGGEGEPLTGDEESPLKGSASLTVPVKAESGTIKVSASIRPEDSDRVLVSKQFSVNVTNQAPEFTGAKGQNEEVCMEGFPWAYQKVDNLLEAYFGQDKLFNLCRDEEQNLTSVTITVENVQGLKLPDYGETEDGNWSFKVEDAENSVVIAADEPGRHKIRLAASDGANELEVFEGEISVYSKVLRYVSYAAAGLAALLLLLIIILIIRHASKPSFENIRLRCFASSDEEPERGEEIMNKSDPVPLSRFKKKGVPLDMLLILFRQPALGGEHEQIAGDIMVFPAKHNGLNIVFGKDAMKAVGRHARRENIALGGSYRMRIGNVYITIENVQQ